MSRSCIPFQNWLTNIGNSFPTLQQFWLPLIILLHRDILRNWSRECQHSFNKAKETLASSDVMMHYNLALSIQLAEDAPAHGIGAVIAHVLLEWPVAFASHTPSDGERNHAQVEREALSLIFAVNHFHYYICMVDVLYQQSTMNHSQQFWSPRKVFHT